MVLAAGLTADLLWGKWTEGLVTTMVIDLGEPAAAGTLRDRLARTLGDPTLSVGYWVPDQEGYVDESGRPLTLPADNRRRGVKLIDDAGRPSIALIHDPAILDDPDLVADIAAATRLSIANARLQAQIRAQAAQVNASRRRLVAAADQQRHQLENELREGAEQRLTAVAELLNAGGPPLAEVSAGLAAAQRELRELARGIHPATLTDHGLHAAINELAGRSPLPIELSTPAQRCPAPVEAGAYFVCSEALTNVAKYARASRVRISITSDDTQLRVEIADDGIGGADPARGSGLIGLRDRVEALGGHLTIDSYPSHGTRLLAELPLPAPSKGTPADPRLETAPWRGNPDSRHDCAGPPARTPKRVSD
jgi:signal transduction histidine kinase